MVTRLVELLVAPLAWVVVLLVAALVVLALRPRPRAASIVVAVALLVLLVAAHPRVANALHRYLEAPVAPVMGAGDRVDAIILLTGTMDGGATLDHDAPAFNASADRVTVAFELLREGRARDVLVSGSSWSPSEGASEARFVARALERWGIAPERIVVEEASRTTHENAAFAAPIVAARGWRSIALVTSAAHMRRAAGAFAAEGIPVETYAADYVAYDPARHPAPPLPTARALADTSEALRELVARVGYRVLGYAR